jgi:hypothetical protein
MRFLFVAEALLGALFLVVFVSQVLMPLWRGTALVPFFRRERKLEAELTLVRQEQLEKSLEEQIQETRCKTPEDETPNET